MNYKHIRPYNKTMYSTLSITLSVFYSLPQPPKIASVNYCTSRLNFDFEYKLTD